MDSDFFHPRTLQLFCVLAEELHFGRAAARLGIPQSSLSDQLRQLESLLDAVLFDRSSRVVKLTPAGRAFIPTARRGRDDALRLVIAAQQALKGPQMIRIGVGVGAIGLIDRVGIDERLRTEAMNVDEGTLALRRGEIDAVLLSESDRWRRQLMVTDGMDWYPICTDGICGVMRRDHPLAGKPTLGLASAARFELFLSANSLGATSHRAEKFMAVLGVTANVKIRKNTLEALPEVMSGSGIALGSIAMLSWLSSMGLAIRPFEPNLAMTLGFLIRHTAPASVRAQLERIADGFAAISAPATVAV